MSSDKINGRELSLCADIIKKIYRYCHFIRLGDAVQRWLRHPEPSSSSRKSTIKENYLKNKEKSQRQLLIRMFSRIHLNLPIESANKNTQNSEMNSACFCLHFSSLKNGRKNGIINSERIISTEGSPCHTTKRRGMRFMHIMKHTILPEASLLSMT